MAEKSTISDEDLADLIRQGQSRRQIKTKYRVGESRFSRVYNSLSRKGVAPSYGLNREAAPGFVLKGHSDFVDEETGELVRRWLKYDTDKLAQYQAMVAAAEALSSEIPRLPPLDGPAFPGNPLCNLYTLTDCHVGMRAWEKEGGNDWDLSTAEWTIVNAFRRMMESAPTAKRCVVNQLGDMLHQDGLQPMTPTSGHILDSASQYAQMVDCAIRIMRQVVDMALSCHEEVHLVIAEGNHDLIGSLWLRRMFAALYENEPRLTVNCSELPVYAHQHGKVMLGFHHGHLKANHQLPLVFADLFPEMWGSTRYRFAHTGHRHHYEEKEHSGMTVVQHQTISAKDAHSSRHMYGSDRRMDCITYHEAFGKVASNYVSPEMVFA